MPIESFPFVTESEFGLACESFVQGYGDAYRIAGDDDDASTVALRQKMFGPMRGRQKYLVLKKVQHLSTPGRDPHEADASVTAIDEDAWNIDGGDEGDDVDDDDHECLRRPSTSGDGTSDCVDIEYHIVLSPAYRVPVLYFRLTDTSSTGLATIEAAYEHIVPERHQASSRHGGVMGSLSMGYHPIDDIPFVFIHPCRTADALREAVAWDCPYRPNADPINSPPGPSPPAQNAEAERAAELDPS